MDKIKIFSFDQTAEYGRSLPLLRAGAWKSKIVKCIIITSAKRRLPKGTYYEVRLSPLHKLPGALQFIAWYYYQYIPHRLIKWKNKPGRLMPGGNCFLIGRFKA